jgi:nucleotide-binding universal stress UspA family protein
MGVPMTHIMVATDGSGGASRAVQVAAELAKALDRDLLPVTVAECLLREEARQLSRTGVSLGDVLESLSAQTPKAREACARQLGSQRIDVRLYARLTLAFRWILFRQGRGSG